jgi:hypothetical protein
MPLPLTPCGNDPAPELIWTFRTGQSYRLPQATVLPVPGIERRLFSSVRGLVTLVTELTRFHFGLNCVNTYKFTDRSWLFMATLTAAVDLSSGILCTRPITHFKLSSSCSGSCTDVKANSHIPCCAHAAPLPCSDSAVSFVEVHVVAGNTRTASPTI